MSNARLEWVLRIATACVFAGHGIYALQANPAWLMFFTTVGLSTELGQRWMPIIGTLDVFLAAMMVLRPARGLLIWMVLWALWTALLRPLSGMPWLEFLERGGNWGAPLALLLVRGLPRSWGDLVR